MACELKIALSATQDLKKIVQYMVQELHAPEAANHFLQQVDLCYDHIRAFPTMYESCEMAASQQAGLRKALIGNYVLIYQVDEEKSCATVLRFFYGRRDFYKDI